MTRFQLYPFLCLGLALVIGACSSGPRADRKDPPAGATRAEFVYQIATSMADQGFCNKAMPVFVCLAAEGTGWEVAAKRAGQCGPLAAISWKPPTQSARANQQIIRRGRILDISINMTFEESPEQVRAEGLRQLRRAANANWPDAQAELIAQLSGQTNEAQREAKLWLTRYDANPRRKIYGGDAVHRDVRERLKTVAAPAGADDSNWTSLAFTTEALNEPECDQLLRKRPHRNAGPKIHVEDDSLEKTRPRRRIEEDPFSVPNEP